MSAPFYWRCSQGWSDWIGRTGRVIALTTIRVAPSGLVAPYDYVIVDFGSGKRAEFSVVSGEVLALGDLVRCVLRRLPPNDDKDVIPYAIKVAKIEP